MAEERKDWEQGPPQSVAAGTAAGREGASAGSLRGPAVWPLHPLLFAAASVLALYAANLNETTFADVVPALAVAVGAAAGLFLLAGALLRGFGMRAAIVASIVVVTVVYHADIFDRLDRLLDGALPAEAALPLALIVAAGLIVLAVRARFVLVLPNALLNGIGFVFLVTPLWSVGSYAWETATLPEPDAPPPLVAAGPGATAAGPEGAAPDIYYFIFDRYGSADTLARDYGIDNRPFLDGLRDRGFYVAEDSYSNYPKTAPSLAATFNMDYLDFLADHPLAARNEWHPIYDMLEDHRVGRFLQERGYRMIQVGSWWKGTQHNAGADENYSFGFSEFDSLYLQRTLLPKLAGTLLPDSAFARMIGWGGGQCRRVPLQFEQVKAIAERPEPTFTFVHVIVPHDPFIFDAEGNCLSREAVRERGRQAGYVAQLAYANRLMDDVVDSLLAGEDKPVIILQADEGPYPEGFLGSNRSWTTATAEELATKSGILNAWYLPDGDYGALYPEITPVNTFRLLFDTYFGAGLGLLPDRVFHFPDYTRIYDFFEVTDQVLPEARDSGD